MSILAQGQRTISLDGLPLLNVKADHLPLPKSLAKVLHVLATSHILDNILLSWIPESLLPAAQSEYYVKVELLDLDSSRESTAYSTKADVLVPPPPQGELYAFSLPLSQIYSLFVRPPRIGWWSGSLVVNARGGETHPALFFHDAECKVLRF